jgi:hypothetical protein
MVIRNQPRKKPKNYRVQMAVRAIEVNYSASEPPMGGFDPSPTALGLDDAGETETCSNPHCCRPAVDACIICGQQRSVLA